MIYCESDFPKHLKYLVDGADIQIDDISGLSVQALEMIKKHNISGLGIDIGSGTGYFSLQVARNKCITMLGIEILDNLVLKANSQAMAERLSCKFKCEDALRFIDNKKYNDYFDLGVLLASGDIFNSPFDSVQRIEKCIKKLGYILVGYISEKNRAVRELNEIKKLGNFIIKEKSH